MPLYWWEKPGAVVGPDPRRKNGYTVTWTDASGKTHSKWFVDRPSANDFAKGHGDSIVVAGKR